MKRMFCKCGQEIFFDNLYCAACGRDLAYDPTIGTMWSGEVRSDSRFYPHTSDGTTLPSFKICNHRYSVVNCNWLISPEDEGSCQCVSCRTTRTIPDLNLPKNPKRWRVLERAKRQLMYTLLDLKLMDPQGAPGHNVLRFDFLEDQRSNPNVALEHVLTGHSNGLITLNVAEADEGFLHVMKEQMGERYRTLLGHFRHEVGHYFWHEIIEQEGLLEAFREVFGDERVDYDESLKTYYEKGSTSHWKSQYITPYASSHPHEDWAETWAHYLHMVDTLETAVSYSLSVYEPRRNDFDDWFSEWKRVSQVMNALNRSMGLADPYPFILSPVVQGKLRFIDEVVDAHFYRQSLEENARENQTSRQHSLDGI
jgi:hypothetical protein